MTAGTLTRRGFLTMRAVAARKADTWSADDDFESEEALCALLAESRPFLADEARRHGIATENRCDLDILKDVFARATRPADPLRRELADDPATPTRRSSTT